MNITERLQSTTTAFLEGCKQELGIAVTIAAGSIALISMARNPDQRDVAAYETARAAELETYSLASDLQKEGPDSRAAANAVDKLGQELSNVRGELEDKLAEETDYFDS